MSALNDCDKTTAAIGIFFDAEKAYDLCPHEGIISSLAVTYKVPSFLLHIVKNFLTHRTQMVRVEGSIIASLLFISYMAPVQCIQFSEGASTVGYADDLCYLRAIKEDQDGNFDVQDIEQDINKIKEVVTGLNMKLNVSKTKAVLFSLAPTSPSIPTLKLDGEMIELVDTYKYLGVWVDRKLRWNIYAKKNISVAKKALGTLRRCRRFLPPPVTRLVYKTVIQPKFLYALPITYPIKNKNDQIAFEYVNNYAASLILDVHRGTYYNRIKNTTLDPIWHISVKRRLALFRAYVDERRFLPEEFLSAQKTTHTLELRSRITKPDANLRKFVQPIISKRAQCETTALSEMITLWNELPNSIIDLNFNCFKTKIKSGELNNILIQNETISQLEVPVRNIN
jgi:hypothetical protein